MREAKLRWFGHVKNEEIHVEISRRERNQGFIDVLIVLMY